MSKPAQVWITGVGALTPLGDSYTTIADQLLAGRSGVRRVRAFDTSQHPSRIAGQVESIRCPQDIEAADFAELDRQEQATLWCCSGALRDAGWWERRTETRVGVVLGIGAEWLIRWETDALADGSRLYRHAEEMPLVQRLCRRLQLSGPAVSLSAACASANYALAQARRWLELGWVDVCVAGACDMVLTPLCLAGFGNLRALSRRNDDPEGASRPFDCDRDGFVMSEGGVVFVLERADSARRRCARVYAEVAGCGASSDAHHMVIPSPDPQHAADAMRKALADACVDPAEVDYINAHATSTPVGDIAEARVLQAVFGPALSRVPVSSTKSMTGHLLTTAAAMEALACLVSLERHALPPTINLDNPDPECPLCHVANVAQERQTRLAVSNSFGFGGSNTCLVLRAA